MLKRLSAIALLMGGLCIVLTGCSNSPARVEQPGYAPEAGAEALTIYDANGDGAIAGDELELAGSLRASIKQVDTDGDGRITAEEIDARIQSWRDSRVGELTAACQVSLDGKPLAGAQVVLEPESFLGTSVPPAYATTNDEGSAAVSMAAEDLADPRYTGVACGWYKIRITSDTTKIPAQFNTNTTLGCEITTDAHWSHKGTIQLDLTSK